MQQGHLCTVVLVALFNCFGCTGAQRVATSNPVAQTDPLSRTVSVRLPNTTFAKAIDALRAQSKANIFVSWPALAEVGVTRFTPLEVDLKDVRLSRALDVVLAGSAKWGSRLDYELKDNVIHISTPDDFATMENAQFYEKVRNDNLRVEALLDRPLPAMRFEKTTLRKALEAIAKSAGVQLWGHWEYLPETTITLNIEGSSARSAIQEVLNAAEQDEVLAFGVFAGRVEVSARDNFQSLHTETRVYDVRLLLTPPHGPPPATIPTTNPADSEPYICILPTDEEDAGERLIRIIQDAIDPDSWRDQGGIVGTIRMPIDFPGRLIVTQTAENQNELSKFLARLKASSNRPLSD